MSMIRGVMRKEDELEVMDGVPGVSAEEFQLAREKIQFCPKQFRFAVSGAGGTGKSSLINNFLNLGHEDGAPTGITEITFTIGRYSDPGDQPPRKWTVWYDIPGAGSFSIKTLEYFKQQCLFIFDLVLVVFDSRFEQINLSIIRDCRRFKIPSFIIRSKTYTQISHCMRSNGYDSDDDNDPEATKELRRISREHAVAETPKNVKEELQKAGFLLQRVYLVLISDIFRRAYAAFISDEKVPIEVDNTGKFVDERELIHDLMIAALARRCDIIPEVYHASISILRSPMLTKCIHSRLLQSLLSLA